MTLGTDEILLSLVDPGRIVAVTHYALDPGISNVPSLAAAVPHQIRQAGVEQVAALEPDLILLASYTSPEVVDQLAELGFPMLKLERFSSIGGLQENIRAIGRRVGAAQAAAKMIDSMTQRLRDLEEKMAAVKMRPGVLSYGPGGWTAGSETTFHEMVLRAGGRNLAAEAGLKGHRQLSLETLVSLDPEIIVLSAWSPEASDFLDKFTRNPVLKHLSAVRKNRVYVLPERYLTTVSQYIVDATFALAKHIHPAYFRAMP